MSDGPWVCYMEALIHLQRNLLPWSYLCHVKKNHLHFHQNSGQDRSSLNWQCATLLPLGEFVIGFLSEKIVLRYLLIMNYVHVHRFIMTRTGSHLPVSIIQASMVPEAGYGSVLFYSHICCWLYYIGLLTYGTHLFYPKNSLYMCDWLQNSTEYQCIWQLLHNSASVCSMVKPAGWSWWGGDLHNVMLAGIRPLVVFQFSCSWAEGTEAKSQCQHQTLAT